MAESVTDVQQTNRKAPEQITEVNNFLIKNNQAVNVLNIIILKRVQVRAI